MGALPLPSRIYDGYQPAPAVASRYWNTLSVIAADGRVNRMETDQNGHLSTK
jgi:hypothetical protein